ncbi:MAG: PLP-dependent aspartate aminotransferase family protein [Bdellovibrionales bacterium]|nr:PLP-dependent aspartate aminotransferase family protein [Bdellovibrionales bacterium]
MNDSTRLQHPTRIPVDPSNQPLTTPIYQSVKFENSGRAQLLSQGSADRFFYSRVANPTVKELEVLLAALQGTEDGFATPSGLSAISLLLLSLLKSGDHVILFKESYLPTRKLVRQFLSQFQISHSLLSVHDYLSQGDACLNACLKPGRKHLLFFESPTNPRLHLLPIKKLTSWAEKNQVLTCLDNTFAGPHQHKDLGLDLYLHSLTKSVGGHGDVCGGVILGKKEVMAQIRLGAMTLGTALDPHSAFLFLRGLKTYLIRYQTQSQNAERVAAILSTLPEFQNVSYPGLASHPQHQLAKEQLKDFGFLISCDLSRAVNMDRFLAGLQIVKFAASLGSTESLVLTYAPFFTADYSEDEKKHLGLGDNGLRFSIGLEDPADIIEDIQSALNQARL